MKSTKAMDIPGAGVLVQVTTREHPESSNAVAVAEALEFIPNTFLMDKEDGTVEILAMVNVTPMGGMDLSSTFAPGYMAEETP